MKPKKCQFEVGHSVRHKSSLQVLRVISVSWITAEKKYSINAKYGRAFYCDYEDKFERVDP